MRKLTLELKAARITDCNKKYFKQKLFRIIKFPKKSQWAHVSISPTIRVSELERSSCLKYYYVLEL